MTTASARALGARRLSRWLTITTLGALAALLVPGIGMAGEGQRGPAPGSRQGDPGTAQASPPAFALLGEPLGEGNRLELGTVFVGHPTHVLIEVQNTGGGTLELNWASSDMAVLAATPAALSLTGGQRGSLELTVTPATEGAFSVTAHLVSNAAQGQMDLHLEGIALAPPSILVTPSALTSDLPVGGAENRALTISNSGGTALEFTTETRAEGGACPPVAAWVAGAGANALMRVVLPAGTASAVVAGLGGPWGIDVPPVGTTAYATEFDAQTLSRLNTTSGAREPIAAFGGFPTGLAISADRTHALVSLLDTGEIASVDLGSGSISLLPGVLAGPWDVALESGESTLLVTEYFAGNLTRIDLVSGAATVIAAGLIGPAGLAIDPSGQLAYVAAADAGELLAVDLTTGSSLSVATGLGAPTGIALAGGAAYVVDAAADRLLRVELATGDVTVAASGIGVPFGGGLELVYAECQVEFLAVAPASGSVAASGSAEVTARFDTQGQAPGDLAAEIVVRSNDPAQPEVIVPALLRVTSAPDIRVSNSHLDFGSPQTGGSATLNVAILNLGTEILNVSALEIAPADYAVSSLPFTIPPGGGRTVAVTFTPRSAGEIPGVLSLSSDDPDAPLVTVDLIGIGRGVPDVQVSPLSLSVELARGASTTQIVSVSNLGSAPLGFSLNLPFPLWLRVTPTAGSVPSGAIVHLSVTIDATGMSAGDYATDITLTSDDSDERSITVLVALRVTPAPVLRLVGEARVLESTIGYTARGASTRHRFLLDEEPTGPGQIEVVADGYFASRDRTALVSVEGQNLGSVGEGSPFCHIVTAGFPVSPADLTVVTADGIVEVLVENSSLVDNHCGVNRHTVRLLYDVRADPVLFGTTLIGQASSRGLSVHNDGNEALEITSITTDSSLFEPSATALSVPPGGESGLTITFDPSAAGDARATLTLESNDPGRPVIAVELSGSGVPPPEIDASPTSLSAALTTGEVATREISVANHGGSVLHLTAALPDGLSTTLEDVRAALEAGHDSISAAIPDRYDFFGGELGGGISNGGLDMYYGGNALNTDRGDNLPATNGPILATEVLGPGGRYFTRKYRGLFVLAADLDDVDRFAVLGTLGAQGSGSADGLVLEATQGIIRYRAFVKRVHGASVPSVNHVFIIGDIPEVTHTFPDDTGDDFHEIGSLRHVSRLYYLLYAGSDGRFIDDAETRGIVDAFLAALPSPWLAIAPPAVQVDPGTVTTLRAQFDPGRLPGGDYAASIALASDDPDEPEAVVAAHLHVSGAPDIRLTGEEVVVESSQDYAESTGDSDHHLLVPGPPGGEGKIEVVAYGDFGYSGFQVSAEGLNVGSVPRASDGLYCSPAAGTFDLSAREVSELAADGIVEVRVLNDSYTASYCDLNRHTVRLTFPLRADPLDFGTVFVGEAATRSITIHNDGTAVLEVSGIVASSAAYTPSATAFVVGVGESRRLEVTFRSDAAGARNAVLTLTTNDPDEPVVTLELSATGRFPPEIEIAPAAIEVSLFTGDTAEPILSVANRGLGDLRATLEALPTHPAGSPESRVLLLASTNVDASIVRALTDLGRAYDLRGPWGLETFDFAPYDVILLAPSSANLEDADVAAVTAAAATGKTLMIVGGDDARYFQALDAYLLSNMGWQNWRGSLAPHLQVARADDWLAAGLPQSITFRNSLASAYALRIDDPEALVVAVNGDGHPALVRKEIGAGRLVYFINLPYASFWEYQVDYEILRQIIDNVLQATPPWLAIATDELTVPPGGIANVGLALDATGLGGGDYDAQILIASNDPDEARLVVPLRMHVTGDPELRVGEQISIESAIDYSGAGATTQHPLAVTGPIIGGGEITVIVDGGFAQYYQTAVATVEGMSLATFGGTSHFCSPSGGTVAILPGRLATLAADGTIQVEVRNSAEVSATCDVNRHTVRLNYERLTSGFEFPALYLGQSESTTLSLHNLGTGVLEIQSVSSDSAAFTPSVSAVTLPPGESASLSISFTALSAGVQQGTLTLATNDRDQPLFAFSLAGTGIVPPEIVVAPPSLASNLFTGATELQALAIANPGGTNLVVEVLATTASREAASTADPAVLLLQDANPWGVPANTDALESLGIDFDLATAESLSSIDLSGYQVVIVAAEQPPTFYQRLAAAAPKIDAFVAHGGSLEFHVGGWGWAGGFPWHLVLPGGVVVREDGAATNHVLMPAHPIVAGVPPVFGANLTTVASFTELPAATVQIIANNHDEPTLIAYRFGLGTVVAAAQGVEWDFHYGTESELLLPNMIAYLHSLPPPFFEVQADSAVIPPGESVTISVGFDAFRLAGGDYAGEILLASNDPEMPRVSVPVQLHVTSAPDLALAGAEMTVESQIDFFTFGATTTHDLPVTRPPEGRAEIEVVADGDYGSPWEYASVTAEGTSLGTLGGVGADCAPADGAFSLSAETLAALAGDGVVSVELRNSIDVDSFCPVNSHTVRLRYRAAADRLDFGRVFVGESVSLPVVIRNDGTSDLEVRSILSDSPAFAPVPSSLDVAAGHTATIMVSFAPTESGAMAGQLNLATNDPDEPTTSVALTGTGATPQDLSLAPRTIIENLFVGDITTRTLTIANVGGTDLNFSLEVRIPLPKGETADLSPPPLPVSEPAGGSPEPPPGVDPDAQDPERPPPVTLGEPIPVAPLPPARELGAPFLFTDDFEDGDLSGWELAATSSLKEVTEVTAAAGTLHSYHERDYATRHAQGIAHNFAAENPSYIGFWVRPGSAQRANGYVVVFDPTGYELILFLAYDDGKFYVNGDVGGNHAVPYSPLSWYHIEFKRINYASKTFDYYVNAALVQKQVPFRNPNLVTAVARVELYNFHAGAEAWWDEIVLADREIGWVSASPVEGTVRPGESVEVAVTLDATDLLPGEYGAEIVLASDDLDEPEVLVPIGLHLSGGPNLSLVGEEIVVTSTAEFSTYSAMTAHVLPVTIPPKGDGAIDLVVSGDFGGLDELATLSIEGATFGSVGGGSADCAPVMRRFGLTAATLSTLLADGQVEAAVRNSPTVDLFCELARHTLSLRYEAATDALDFGDVFLGVEREMGITVRNTGTEALELTVRGAPPVFVASIAALTLPPGASERVVVAFRPWALGEAESILTLSSNDPDTPFLSVRLEGRGTVPPALEIRPATLAVVVATGADRSVPLTVANPGGGVLEFKGRAEARVGPLGSTCESVVALAAHQAGRISEINLESGVMRFFATVNWSAQDVTLDGARGRVYATASGAGMLWGIDRATGQGQVGYGNGDLFSPSGAAVDPSGRQVYVVNRIPNVSLAVVDLHGEPVRVYSGLPQSDDVELDPDGRQAYLTGPVVGQLNSIDLTTGSVRTIASGLAWPLGLGLDVSAGIAYVAESAAGRLTAVNLVTGAATPILTGLLNPVGVEVDTAGRTVYVTSESGLDAVDLGTLTPRRVTGEATDLTGFALESPAGCASDFMSVVPAGGRGLPGTEAVLEVRIDARRLPPGSYGGEVVVESNDPQRPTMVVPVAVQVVEDGDGDGIGDPEDNCLAAANPQQEDGDEDLRGDVCDNCPSTANPGQADRNQDGAGDACQPNVVITAVVQDGGPVLEVRASLTDPQGDPLTGTLTILSAFNPGPGSEGTTTTVLISVSFTGSFPPRVPLAGLVEGADYVLRLSVTDGGTPAMVAEATFAYNGEATMAFNLPPQAVMLAPAHTECDRAGAGAVLLDGSLSQDPDSSPGASDDIARHDWFEDLGLPTERLLGTGPTLAAILPLGAHAVSLRVTDQAGETDTTSAVVTVEDTQPPSPILAVTPEELWPAEHQMERIAVSWEAADLCDPAPAIALVSITSSEPDDAAGVGDGATTGDIAGADVGTADPEVELRAERAGTGTGRTYELTYRMTDGSGNGVSALGVVLVPRDLGQGRGGTILKVEANAGGYRWYWSQVPEATGFDLVSGALEQVVRRPNEVNLGSVEVLGRGRVDAWLDDPAQRVPAPRRCFFYVVEGRTERGGWGYGEEPLPWPRVPEACAGGCP